MAEVEMKMDRPIKQPNMGPQIILYVVLAALIFGIGGYYLGSRQVKNTSTSATVTPSAVASKRVAATVTATSSVDATANWKTYTNDTYGFSFKYPSDWVERGKSEHGIRFNGPENEVVRKQIEETPPGYSDGYTDDVILVFNSLQNYAKSTLNKEVDSLDKLIQEEQLKGSQISSAQKTTWGGQDAWDYIANGMGSYYEIITKNGSDVISLAFGNADSKSKLTALDKQILSTFQFTK